MPFASGRFVRVLPLASVLALMLGSAIQANESGSRNGHAPNSFSSTPTCRRVAAYLGKRLTAGSTLMCHQPWLAVWAGADWRVSPSDTPEQRLRYALSREYDFVLLRGGLPLSLQVRPWHCYHSESLTVCGRQYQLFDLRKTPHRTVPE